jgi:thioredoxin reductase (NADPH)
VNGPFNVATAGGCASGTEPIARSLALDPPMIRPACSPGSATDPAGHRARPHRRLRRQACDGAAGKAGAAAAALPVIIMVDRRVLENPSNTQIAGALGVQTSPGGGLYGVAVIGAGPAGPAAAVYGASDGLSTVMLEPEAIGGQAGPS